MAMMMMAMIVMVMTAIRSASVIWMIVIKEMRIIVERAVEIKGAAVEHRLERNLRAFGAMDAG